MNTALIVALNIATAVFVTVGDPHSFVLCLVVWMQAIGGCFAQLTIRNLKDELGRR